MDYAEEYTNSKLRYLFSNQKFFSARIGKAFVHLIKPIHFTSWLRWWRRSLSMKSQSLKSLGVLNAELICRQTKKAAQLFRWRLALLAWTCTEISQILFKAWTADGLAMQTQTKGPIQVRLTAFFLSSPLKDYFYYRSWLVCRIASWVRDQRMHKEILLTPRCLELRARDQSSEMLLGLAWKLTPKISGKLRVLSSPRSATDIVKLRKIHCLFCMSCWSETQIFVLRY